MVEYIQNKIFHEIMDSSDGLQGEGVKYVIPSTLIDIYIGLEIIKGLKLSGHTGTLRDLASNLFDALYRRGEIQNERQYRNALDKFYTI